jgi:V8-like Glu-specific endopeptidase
MVSRPEALVTTENPKPFLSFAQLKNLEKLGNAVVLVETPTGFATGFMISPTMMITNQHVFDTVETVRNSKVEFFYTGTHREENTRSLIPETYLADERLDIAIVQVGPPSSSSPSSSSSSSTIFIPLSARSIDYKQNPSANIIGHPDGMPLMFSLRGNIIQPMIDHPFLCLYTTNTFPGSSGSPGITDDGHLLFIHRQANLVTNSSGDILNIYANTPEWIKDHKYLTITKQKHPSLFWDERGYDPKLGWCTGNIGCASDHIYYQVDLWWNQKKAPYLKEILDAEPPLNWTRMKSNS